MPRYDSYSLQQTELPAEPSFLLACPVFCDKELSCVSPSAVAHKWSRQLLPGCLLQGGSFVI